MICLPPFGFPWQKQCDALDTFVAARGPCVFNQDPATNMLRVRFFGRCI
jgi:hypothetical protein